MAKVRLALQVVKVIYTKLPANMRTFSLTAVIVTLLSSFAQAQDNPLIDIDIDRTEWYENPLLWVGVAAFFIILIIVTRRKSA